MNRNQNKIETDGQMRLFRKRRSEMTSEERVFALREKLYQKAKQDSGYKFYVLYDKVFLPYILETAWKAVKTNGGSPGIDKVTIEDIEKQGVEKFLSELGEELRKQTYHPQAVKRVMIPKANGGERPLGIPTIKDRVAQAACKLIIEPIFEADFEETSYGFRPKRSAKDAIRIIKHQLQQGKTMILDADLSKYFDTIPHDKLKIALKERIADPRILKLIDKWLKAPVFEDGQFKGGKGNHTGTPQGGVISPLLANVYLHLLDRIVRNPKSLFSKLGIEIIRYADDFVLMGKELTQEALEKLESLLTRMGLTLNKDKTKQKDAKQESFDFLGFTLRYDQDLQGKKSRYWNIIPSKKSEQKVRDKVRDFLGKNGHSKVQAVALGLNAIVGGWLRYFEIQGTSYPAMSKRKLRFYLSAKLHRYFNRKSQRKSRLYRQKAFEVLTVKYGLIDPTKYSFRPAHS